MAINDERQIGCKVCGNQTGNRTHQSQEKMLGLGGRFAYVECADCGCLALQEVPENFASYYPPTYSSFVGREDGFRGFAKKLRVQSYFGKKSFWGSWIAERYPRPDLAAMAQLNAPKDCRILDVGCGAGKLLLELSEMGYRNLVGVDPFIQDDLCYANGVHVRECFLTEFEEGPWDLIMFHHSFEHIPNQAETLRASARLLAPGGMCLIRIPVVGWAWENYGTDWVQLDAPRHLFLHTEKSLGLLAESAGFRLLKVEYDSFEFQLWGSELYQRGIALKTAGVPRRFFSRKQLQDFKKKSEKLNATRRGDQAVFFLRLS